VFLQTALATASVSGRSSLFGAPADKSFTYYVDPAGNDANNGTTANSPFRTVAKVNSLSLKPGESVGFKAGGVWRENLVIRRSGNAVSGPITYGAYGSGPQPVISGSEAATWMQVQSAAPQESSPAGGFASGFEAANFSDWTGMAIDGKPTLTVSTKNAAHGLTSMEFTGDGVDNRGVVYKKISPMAPGSTYYFRVYMFTPSRTLAANSALKYLQFYAGSKYAGYAALNTDAAGNVSTFTLNMYTGGGYPIANSSMSGKYLMDQWNCVEVAYKTDSVAGSMQVWINGASIASASRLNTGANIGLDQIQIGNGNYGPIVAKGSSIYFDDVQVSPSGPIGQANLLPAGGSGSRAQETAPVGGFASGFEAPGFSDWTGIALDGWPTLAVSGTNPAHGVSCMQFTGDGRDNRGSVYKSIPAMGSGSAYYFRVYVYTPSATLAPNDAIKYLQFYSGSNFAGYAALGTDGAGNISTLTLNMYAGGGYPIANVSLSGKYFMDQWNCVEIAYKTDATSGFMQAWVNGVSIGNSGALNTSANIGVDQVRLGNGNWGPIIPQGKSIFFDDFQFSPNGPIGLFPLASDAAIWRTNVDSDPLYPSIAGQPGIQVPSLAAMAKSGQWYWDRGNTMYLCSATNPATTVEIPKRPYAVNLQGASYIVLSQLNCRGARISGIFATGGCNTVTISDCTVELNWENGGYFLDGGQYQNNGVVQRCILRRNGGSGWNTNGLFSKWLFDGNEVYSNGQVLSGSVEHDFSAGIKMFSTTGMDGTGTVAQNNICYANGAPGGNAGQGVGLWADTCRGITFRSNRVYNNNGWGVFLEKNFNSVACFNIAYNNAIAPYCANIGCKASDTNNASNNRVYNNTCSGGWWGVYCGAYEDNGHSTIDTQVWNNNIAINSKYANLYVDAGGNNDGVNGFGNIYANNCFGAVCANLVLWAGRGMLTSYADFDSVCASPSRSVQADPLFTDPATGVFTLKVGSPCIGTGLVLPGLTNSPVNVGAL
jgi:hypothetical protein